MSVVCPFCSEEVEAAATKCRHCGEGLAPRPPERPSDDLTQVMGWVFEDPKWVVKLIIGVACVFLSCPLLLLPLFALMGFKFRIARQQQRAPGATPMPEWGDDLPGLVFDGFKEVITVMLPGLAFMLLFGLVVGAGAVVDLGLTGQPGVFMMIAMVVGYLCLLVGLLFMTYFTPAIELQYLETGSPLASLHLRALWRRVTTRPGDYFMLFIYHFVVQIIGGFLAFLLYAPVIWGFYTQGALLGRYLAQQRAKDAALGL